MTIARACRPPAQAFCRRLAGRWWIAQHPPRAVSTPPPTTTKTRPLTTITLSGEEIAPLAFDVLLS